MLFWPCRLVIVALLIDSKMSGGLDVLALREDDVAKFLSCQTHVGVSNLDFQMEQYVFKRRSDGNYDQYNIKISR